MNPKWVHNGEVDIPEGIEVNIEDEKSLIVKGKLGVIKKDFKGVPVIFRIDNGKLKFLIYRKGKKGYALVNTIKKRIKNMFIGITKGFTYKMRVFYVHFPMSIEVSDEYVIIKNFTGERGIRRARIMPGVKVSVEKKGSDVDVIIKGIDKDAVGQTAANIYLATKVKRKDPRVFLDGVYLYSKSEGM